MNRIHMFVRLFTLATASLFPEVVIASTSELVSADESPGDASGPGDAGTQTGGLNAGAASGPRDAGATEGPGSGDGTASDASPGLLGPGLRIFVGPRVGGLFPFSKASPSYNLGLEIGAQAALDGMLGGVLELSYRRPRRTVTNIDPRLPEGQYVATLVDEELAVFIGPRLMIEVAELFVPFAALGLGVHMVRTTVDGTSLGVPFGESHEQSTRVGFDVRLGAGLCLGPGLATVSMDTDLAPLEHLTTGGTRSSAFSLALAYLFSF